MKYFEVQGSFCTKYDCYVLASLDSLHMLNEKCKRFRDGHCTTCEHNKKKTIKMERNVE